jgi:hypothetical protein
MNGRRNTMAMTRYSAAVPARARALSRDRRASDVLLSHNRPVTDVAPIAIHPR